MLFNWKKIDYTSPAAAQGGPGVSKSFTWFVGSPYIDMSLAQMTALGLSPGDTFWVGGKTGIAGGNCFQVVKADAALALGQLTKQAAPAASTLVATITASSATWNAGGLTVNAEVGNWLCCIATGATLPQFREIKSNTATVLTIAGVDYLRPNLPATADVWDTNPTATDPAIIYRPYHVDVCGAGEYPNGVALGTVTQYNYTIIQVAGLAAIQVDADGANEDIALNEAPVTIAAGRIKGCNATVGLSMVEGFSIYPLRASTSAAGVLEPFLVNFLGA